MNRHRPRLLPLAGLQGLGRRRRAARASWFAGVLAAAATAWGCAHHQRRGLEQNAPAASGALSRPDAAMRQALAAGDTTSLWKILASSPKDTLLRLLQRGLVWHRMGRYEASNRALQEADRLAEARYTKSISQNVAAAIINDKSLDYTPAAHERAFIHYYGMLNYLALGQREDALVEARAVNQWLQVYARDNEGRSYTTDALVEYLAGWLHWDGRDENDALVSFRQANRALATYRTRYGIPAPQFVAQDLARLAASVGQNDVVQEASSTFQLAAQDLATPSGTGTVLVLVENGFIAHRAEQKVYIPLLPGEASQLLAGPGTLEVAPRVIARTLRLMLDKSAAGETYANDYRDGILLAAAATNADLVTMAWPRYQLEMGGVPDIAVVADSSRYTAVLMDDLAAIAARGFEEDKPKVIRRMILRGLAKFAVAKLAEEKAAEKGEKLGSGLGKLFGTLAKTAVQTAAAVTEQADVRSWSLLPGEIRVVRLRLPAGPHQLRVVAREADNTERTIDLGSISVTEGGLVVKSLFVAGHWAGNHERFAAATRQVDLRATEVASSGDLPPDTPDRAPATGASDLRSSVPPTSQPAAPAQPIALQLARVSFKPLAEEAATFETAFSPAPSPAVRDSATLRLLVAPAGGSDTAVVWTGREGQQPFWNGRLGDRLAPAGRYTVILQARTPSAMQTGQLVRSVDLEISAPNGLELVPLPSEPSLEPETRVVQRTDHRKKTGRILTGLLVSAIGTGLGVFATNRAQAAIQETPPGSPQRKAAFSLWLGGAAIATTGGIVTLTGLTGRFLHPVSEPDPEAIERNQQARAAYQRALEEAKAQNRKVSETVVMTLHMLGGRF